MLNKGLHFVCSRWFHCVVIFTIAINALILFIPSCSSDNNAGDYGGEPPSKENLMDANREIMRSESEAIESYMSRYGYDMELTSTGLRYMIYFTDSTDLTRVQTDDEVEIAFEVSRLDGSVIYSSDSSSTLILRVDKSELATGLQEGIKHMSSGDRSLMIIPAHLAYGLTGDGDQIGIYEPIVVDVQILRIN